MSRLRVAAVLSLLLALAALGVFATADQGKQAALGENTPIPTKITAAMATVPANITGPPNQWNFNLLAWQSFIALNWPANSSNCTPNTSVLIGQTAPTYPTVWETYIDPSNLFVAPGSQPAKWCAQGSQEASAALLKGMSLSGGVKKFVYRPSKFSDSIEEMSASNLPGGGSTNQAVGGPLTDQNGRWARYEISINQDEYNYLVQNNLWNKAGQSGKTITFPQGPTQYGPVGATEIKAAWKIMGPGDDPSRFYTMPAQVVVSTPSSNTQTQNVTVGLVALHIAHKTAGAPQWTWATFEQVDNTTSSFNSKNCPQTPSYTANPAACTTRCCPPNTQTSNKVTVSWNSKPQYVECSGFQNAVCTPQNQPVQVTRVIPIDPLAQQFNQAFQALLRQVNPKNVWANYQLINMQWPTQPTQTGGVPTPAYLANVALETYNQGPTPPTDGNPPYPQSGYNPFQTSVSSSCMKCHSQAIDFSFEPYDAQ